MVQFHPRVFFWGDMPIFSYYSLGIIFFFSPSFQIRHLDGFWCAMGQNTQNHARLKPVGYKKIKLTFGPYFRPKMWKFGPKTGLLNFLPNKRLTSRTLIKLLLVRPIIAARKLHTAIQNTNVNGDIVSYTSKTAKITKGKVVEDTPIHYASEMQPEESSF